MKRILLTMAAIAVVWTSAARLRLPEIIGDNMVLQQASQAMLWGWSDTPGAVEVSVPWNGETYRAATGSDGLWKIAVPTPAAGYTPYEITVTDASGDRCALHNVLVGEVWFCSGQSNMEMPLNGFWNQPVEHANDVIARAGRYKGVRVAKVANTVAQTPQAEVKGGWKESLPEHAPWFSATAYFFATSLNEILDCPVGVIDCSWGGSRIEAWLPEEILRTYPDIDLGETTSSALGDWQRPLVMYNGMLAPMQNYTIRGFVWYQGCSNVGREGDYAQRMSDLVTCWRRQWGLGELPFYYVEIAPFEYGDGKDAAPYLREAQFRAQSMIPSSGMVSIADLVLDSERYCIHPRMKRQVGERLAYMALSRTYEVGGVACECPVFRSMEIEGPKALLSFDHAQDGLTAGAEIPGFEAAGSDRKFYPASARILGDRRVEVTCREVPQIVAVRYCFHDWAPSRLWNMRGLPVVPFRTDDWK